MGSEVMAMVVVGLNHKTAPVAVREQLAIAEPELAEPLAHFQHPALHELVILSTCNRVELYMEASDTAACVAACTDFLATYRGIAPEAFEPHLVYRYDAEAVRHLFRVAASLDSLVVGEPQILGQVKAAYMTAQQADRTGLIFNQLFDRALGWQIVRQETASMTTPVGWWRWAGQENFESLQRTAMVLGAGETSELAARHLVRQGVTSIFVANRTHDRAVRLAQALQAKAIPWESVEEHLVHTDIVVSSTAAPDPIVDKPMVQRAMRARRGQSMFFIDIAVPRDIAPEVNHIENVFLYDIDDLEHVIAANRREREREALVAEEIVWREVRQFERWLEARDACRRLWLCVDRRKPFGTRNWKKPWPSWARSTKNSAVQSKR